MTNKEKVLCITRKLLPAQWVGKKTILKLKEDFFFNICSRAGFQWIDRNIAETEPSLKQIIPYSILQTENGDKTAIYKRHGTEKRLHDLWSAGIGGHINPKDSGDSIEDRVSISFRDILFAGMKRELDEELIQRPDDQPPVFAGIINEEITEVGSVHMGVIFRLITNTPARFVPGDELKAFQWQNTRSLGTYHMELWSQLALDLIA